MLRFLFAFVTLVSSAYAGTFNVVATGDSNTSGYAPNGLQFAINAQGSGAVMSATRAASGGATTSTYLGLVPDLAYRPATTHNFAQEAVYGPVSGFGSPPFPQVSNPQPNAIIVMIGTNDAIKAATDSTWIDRFKANLNAIYSYYADVQDDYLTLGLINKPQVIVSTILPILDNPTDPSYASANNLINSIFNPYVEQLSVYYQFPLLDLNTDIQTVPNWQQFYSDDAVHPGYVHLNLNGGYTWLANYFLRGVLDQNSGDFNLDGFVNNNDAEIWQSHLGIEAGATWATGDNNHDGKVDLSDEPPLSGVLPIFTDEPSAATYATTALLLLMTARTARRSIYGTSIR